MEPLPKILADPLHGEDDEEDDDDEEDCCTI
jgi:hypothetical protein